MIAGRDAFGSRSGILIAGATTSGNLVQGNHIGTDLSGTINLGFDDYGILIDGAVNTTIGGAGAGKQCRARCSGSTRACRATSR